MADQAEKGSLLEELLSDQESHEEETNPELSQEESKQDGDTIEEKDSQETKPEEVDYSKVVITANFAKQFGLPKEMIGSTIDEMGKSYKLMQSAFTKKTQELSELKKQPAKTSAKAEDEFDYEAELEKLPDPLEDYAAYKKEFAKLQKKNAEYEKRKLREEVLKEIEPKFKPSLELQQRTIVNDTFNALQTELPDADIVKVLESFKEENEDELETMSPVYAKNPALLVRHVVRFYKASQGSELAKKFEKKLAEEATKKAADALRTKKHRDLTSQRRTPEGEPKSLISELADDEEQYFIESGYGG